MPNYLAEKDWKTELSKKEHKDVKKSGISEALRDYEKVSTGGGAAAIGALEEVVKVAKTAKAKYATDQTLGVYLGEIIKSADAHKSFFAKPAPMEPEVASPNLAGACAAAKAVTDPANAFNFLCAPGKVSGLIVGRKSMGAGEIAIIKEQRGKGVGGPVVRGRAYGDGGKLVYDFGQLPPPGGIARAIKSAMQAGGTSMAFVVRGGGVSVDPDTDVEADFESPFEKATGLPDAKAPDRGPTTVHTYITQTQWAARLTAMKQLPAAQRAATLDGIFGQVRVDSEALKADTTQSQDLRDERIRVLREVVASAKALAAAPVPVAAPAPAPQTASVLARRAGIDGMMSKNITFIDKASFIKGAAAALAARPEIALGGQFDPVRKALEACETSRQPQTLQGVRTACDTADARIAELKRLKKEGFPAGASADTLARTDLDLSKDFRTCAKIMAACENDPSDKNTALLGKACGLYLTGLAKARAKVTGPSPTLDANEEVIREWADRVFAGKNGAALEAQGAASLQARTQVRLAEIAADYKTLGPAAGWTREQEGVAAELQAAYLFEEGTVASGAAFGAAELGGEGGVNAAFWVKRKDPIRAGATETAERLFIFKPADAEADVASGLPAGSGAGREVIAKDLADYFGGIGLQVDVCPTNLVKIDAGKLGGTGQPRMGSMQQLGADIKGGIAENLLKDITLAARIDKKDFDQLAVFDLITGNLDRHGGNILLAGDLATKPKLVPIDHGTSMPSAQALKLNRHRILDPQNILTNPDLPQGGQKLSAEAQAALKAVKPAEMAKALRDSQARLAGRHAEAGQPGMGLEEPQIKLMIRGTQFLQAAADKLTVRELFEAKSRFVDEIMADPEPKWDALVADVQKQLAASQASQLELTKLIPTSSLGKFNVGAFQSLGWCMGMHPEAAMQWAAENPERARKILAGRIVNPGLQAEADELRKLAGASAVVDTTVSLSAQVRQLQDLVAGTTGTDDLPDVAALQQEFLRLGGNAVLAEACTFGSDAKSLVAAAAKRAKSAKGNKRAPAQKNLLQAQVEALRAWKLFTDAGGIAELARLGGVQPPTNRVAYEQLISLKKQQGAHAQVDKMSAGDVDKLQTVEIAQQAAEAQASIDKLIVQSTKAAHQKVLDDLLAKQKAGDPGAAQGGMGKLNRTAAQDAASEKIQVKVHREETAASRQLVTGAAPGQIAPPLVAELDALEKLSDNEVLTGVGLKKRRDILTVQVERVALGAQSAYGQIEQRLNAAAASVAKLSGEPFYQAFSGRHTDLVNVLKSFDLGGSIKHDISSLETACTNAERMKVMRPQLQKHPNRLAAQAVLAELDKVFLTLSAASFNPGAAKLEMPLSAAEDLLKQKA